MKNYTRKGEWLQINMPQSAESAGYEEIAQIVPMSRKFWNKLVQEKGVQFQGIRALLRLFPEEMAQFPPLWIDLDILYEDDFCLVVNKPAGMRVHPTDAGQEDTLANAVAAYYAATVQACAIRHIHRLDEHTSGAVLYAKNELAHQLLDEAMRSKDIRRIYLALAEGKFADSKGTISAAIGKDRHHKSRRRVSPTGDHAVTHYQVQEQYRSAALVELELDTGRTHQIRVHLSHIGHPLIGDELYGGSTRLIGRQALHGYKLSFGHPIWDEPITVLAPAPEDFKEVLDRISVK